MDNNPIQDNLDNDRYSVDDYRTQQALLYISRLLEDQRDLLAQILNFMQEKEINDRQFSK